MANSVIGRWHEIVNSRDVSSLKTLPMNAMSAQSLSTWDAIHYARRFDLLDGDPTHLSPN
jgi:hypothetical protein